MGRLCGARRPALALIALGCAMLLASAPARAAEEGPSPGDICAAEQAAAELVGEHSALLSPAEGSTVAVGEPVTFAAESGRPMLALGFAVASSQLGLSSPDIDSGAGALRGGAEYAFTSSKASATPGTIYWDASFTLALTDCERPFAYTTPARRLIVVGPPPPATGAPSAPASPLALRVRISGSRTIRLRRPTVAYEVHCSARCTGSTAVQAWVVRRHARRPKRVSELDFSPAAVSIAGSSGGGQRFTHRYRGAALRRLKGLLRQGAAVELRITAQAAGAPGAVARARVSASVRA